jgi:hypothetical protein
MPALQIPLPIPIPIPSAFPLPLSLSLLILHRPRPPSPRSRTIQSINFFAKKFVLTPKKFTNPKQSLLITSNRTPSSTDYSLKPKKKRKRRQKKVGEEEDKEERSWAEQRSLVKCYSNFIQATKITFIKEWR